MPVCKNDMCKKRKDVDPVTLWCPACANVPASASTQGLPPVDTASLASFPPAAIAAAQAVSQETIASVAESISRGEAVDTGDLHKSLFGMMFGLVKGINTLETKVEKVEMHAKKNEERIKSLEDKVGNNEECSVPLSITMQNVEKAAGYTDTEIVNQVIRLVNAEGVDPVTDVVKVIRKGFKPATSSQKEILGTVLVELSSSEVRAKIMKTKKVLAEENSKVKNVIIKNMKTIAELNQDKTNKQLLRMIPGGNQFYIAGNGSLRPCGPPHPGQGPRGPPRAHQFPNRAHNYAQAAQAAPQDPRALPTPVVPQPGPQTLAPLPGGPPGAHGIYSRPPPAVAPELPGFLEPRTA